MHLLGLGLTLTLLFFTLHPDPVLLGLGLCPSLTLLFLPANLIFLA